MDCLMNNVYYNTHGIMWLVKLSTKYSGQGQGHTSLLHNEAQSTLACQVTAQD